MNESNKGNMLKDEELDGISGGLGSVRGYSTHKERCSACGKEVNLVGTTTLKDGLCPSCYGKRSN